MFRRQPVYRPKKASVQYSTAPNGPSKPGCYHEDIHVRIYLDHNATTPLYPAVVETVARLLRDAFGNASSVHAFGQQAKAELEEARTAVARLLDADPSEVVFTSGGAEADNFALRGTAAVAPLARRRLITTGIAHEAILI